MPRTAAAAGRALARGAAGAPLVAREADAASRAKVGQILKFPCSKVGLSSFDTEYDLQDFRPSCQIGGKRIKPHKLPLYSNGNKKRHRNSETTKKNSVTQSE